MEQSVCILGQDRAINKEEISLIKSFNPLKVNEKEVFNKLYNIKNLKELLRISEEAKDDYLTFFIKGLLGDDVEREASYFISKEVSLEIVFKSSLLDINGRDISPYLLSEIDSIRAKLLYSKSLFLCALFKNPPKIFKDILVISYKANYNSLASKLVKIMRLYREELISFNEVFHRLLDFGVPKESFLKMHLINLNYELEEEELKYILINFPNEAIDCYIEGGVHNWGEIGERLDKYIGDRVLEKGIDILNSGSNEGIKYIKKRLENKSEYLEDIKRDANLQDTSVRKAVVQIVMSYENEEGDKFLAKIKKSEGSKLIKDNIENYFFEREELAINKAENLKNIIAYVNKKVKKCRFEEEELLPSKEILNWINGGVCNENVYKYILISYEGNKEVSENIGIEFLTSKIEGEDLKLFSEFLYLKWLERGALSKDKWILSFVGEHMPNSLVYKMYKLIGKLVNENRYVVATECIKALILSENILALKYLRILQCSFKNKRIINGVEEGFLKIAKKRGVSVENIYDLAILTDEMVAFKKYKLGENEFKTVILDGKVRLMDKERKLYKQFNINDNDIKGKTLNSAFRSFKYLLKKIVDSEKKRLFKAFIEGRSWTFEEFLGVYTKSTVLTDALKPYIFGAFEGENIVDEFEVNRIKELKVNTRAIIKIIKIK